MKPLLSFVLFCFCFSLAAQEPLFFTHEMIASHLQGYNEEEKELIERDLGVVRSVCRPSTPSSDARPFYLATAGAPGARKSTILERFLERHSLLPDVAYIDPDQRALKFMVHTYHSRSLSLLALAGYPDHISATKAAYEKWRGGSNYIALTLLEEAFAQRQNIVHGTTSTGAHAPLFFSALKDKGYDIALFLCFCEDSFRYDAINYRNEVQHGYQSTPEDAVSKGRFFSQRMAAYFDHADLLLVFWSDSLDSPERLAAVFSEGQLEVLDEAAWLLVINKYEQDRQTLQREGSELPLWEEIVQLYFKRFPA